VEELIKKIDELVQAISENSKELYALTAIMAMEHEEDEDAKPQTYLDGTRRDV
jgi:hypothetical protein